MAGQEPWILLVTREQLRQCTVYRPFGPPLGSRPKSISCQVWLLQRWIANVSCGSRTVEHLYLYFGSMAKESVRGCVRQVLRLRFRRTSFDLNAVVVLQGRAGWTSGETRDHHETTQFDLDATWLDRCNMQGLRIRQCSSSKRRQAWAIFIRCTLLLLLIDHHHA